MSKRRRSSKAQKRVAQARQRLQRAVVPEAEVVEEEVLETHDAAALGAAADDADATVISAPATMRTVMARRDWMAGQTVDAVRPAADQLGLGQATQQLADAARVVREQLDESEADATIARAAGVTQSAAPEPPRDVDHVWGDPRVEPAQTETRRSRFLTIGIWLVAISMFILIVATLIGRSLTEDDTPTPQPTMTATDRPTNTPTLTATPRPTSTPTEMPQIGLGPGDCVMSFRLKHNDPLPPGTFVEVGSWVVKNWQIVPDGTCRLGQGYSIEPENGPTENFPAVWLPKIETGQVFNLHITLRAPAEPGTVSINYRIKAGNGNMSQGVLPVYFVAVDRGESQLTPINVMNSSDLTPKQQDECVDKVTGVIDMTIPDGTIVAANQVITKTWQGKNGSCQSIIGLVWAGGEQMGSPAAVWLVREGKRYTIATGGIGIMAITLRAPSRPGVYQGTWRAIFRDGSIGGGFTVVIKVVISVPVPN